jgi:transposase
MDIYKCENKMQQKTKTHLTQEVFEMVRGQSAQERMLHRLHCVLLVLSGLSASKASMIYHDSARAVSYWVKRFKENGLDGLTEDERPGRPASLSKDQVNALQHFVSVCLRQKKSITAQMLADYIRTKFSVMLTRRQCHRILKRLSA